MLDNQIESDHLSDFDQRLKNQGGLFQGLQVPLIVRVNSLTRRQPSSLWSFFRGPKFQICQNPLGIGNDILIKISPRFGRFDILKDYFKANLKTYEKQGKPPSQLTGYRVFLNTRVIEHKIGRRLGVRHLFLTIYENHSKYALIEGYPFFSNVGWVSGAYVRENEWEERGIRWELIPENHEHFIADLKRMTVLYHNAQIPYNYKKGPNSNSFVWWLLAQFNLDISKLASGLVYWGTDYWRYFPIQNFLRTPSSEG